VQFHSNTYDIMQVPADPNELHLCDVTYVCDNTDTYENSDCVMCIMLKALAQDSASHINNQECYNIFL